MSYAVAGAQKKSIGGDDDDDGNPPPPAVLFYGGMYSDRMNGPWIDYLAEKKGVRVIMIDRLVQAQLWVWIFYVFLLTSFLSKVDSLA